MACTPKNLPAYTPENLPRSNCSQTQPPPQKKRNSACHFCDHAAQRPGRTKIALQVPCASPHCRKVFCSRPSCFKKLPEVHNIWSYQDFARWKESIDSGDLKFICPHCEDESTCPGPQCHKRWARRRAKKLDGKKKKRKRRSTKSVPPGTPSTHGSPPKKRQQPVRRMSGKYAPSPPTRTHLKEMPLHTGSYSDGRAADAIGECMSPITDHDSEGSSPGRSPTTIPMGGRGITLRQPISMSLSMNMGTGMDRSKIGRVSTGRFNMGGNAVDRFTMDRLAMDKYAIDRHTGDKHLSMDMGLDGHSMNSSMSIRSRSVGQDRDTHHNSAAYGFQNAHQDNPLTSSRHNSIPQLETTVPLIEAGEQRMAHNAFEYNDRPSSPSAGSIIKLTRSDDAKNKRVTSERASRPVKRERRNQEYITSLSLSMSGPPVSAPLMSLPSVSSAHLMSSSHVISPPMTSPPVVSPNMISPPVISPPRSPHVISPPVISPPTSPPTISPPVISPPAVSPPVMSPPAPASSPAHHRLPLRSPEPISPGPIFRCSLPDERDSPQNRDNSPTKLEKPSVKRESLVPPVMKKEKECGPQYASLDPIGNFTPADTSTGITPIPEVEPDTPLSKEEMVTLGRLASWDTTCRISQETSHFNTKPDFSRRATDGAVPASASVYWTRSKNKRSKSYRTTDRDEPNQASFAGLDDLTIDLSGSLTGGM